MSESVSKLKLNIKTYKKKVEEAEERGALNLAKFRKFQQEEMEEMLDGAKLADSLF